AAGAYGARQRETGIAQRLTRCIEEQTPNGLSSRQSPNLQGTSTIAAKGLSSLSSTIVADRSEVNPRLSPLYFDARFSRVLIPLKSNAAKSRSLSFARWSGQLSGKCASIVARCSHAC